MTVIHKITAACAAVHCWWHDIDEDGPYYRACLECGHLYRTRKELQQAWTGNAPPGMRGDSPPRPGKIFFCPLCLHDF